MRRILIISHSEDITASYIEKKFNEKAVFYRLNVNKLNDYDIKITQEGTLISLVGEKFKLSEINSIYYRKPRLPDFSEYSTAYHKLMEKDIISFIVGIVDSFKGRCLTHPSILRRTENKVFQLSVAKEVGFKLPLSLITNSEIEAENFNENMISIIKPLSLGKFFNGENVHIIQTNLVDKSKGISNLELSPSYFQEYIEKDYELRVTVVAGEFFVSKIISENKVDWRTEGTKFKKGNLPTSIQNKCLLMMKKLELNFGAFDFIVRNNQYYFLEVNPNGQWLWLEEEVGLNISQAIFDYLNGGSVE